MKLIRLPIFEKLKIFDVIALTILSFAVKIYFLQYFDGPLIFRDELYYRQNALAIFRGLQYATPHYPPMYPLFLAPAFFATNWYQAMLTINALLSSMLIPAAWFLGRSIGLRRPFLASLFVALLPMHVVYPRFVMSENLFVPLFVLSFALVVRGGRYGRLEAILFGLTLGATHLTKYLFLPAVPVLFCAWIFAMFFRQNKDIKTPKSDLIWNILYAFSAYFLVMSVWMYYGYFSGFEWPRLLGFGISGNRKMFSQSTTFLFWFIAYSSYALLMAVPLWILLGSFFAQLFNVRFRSQITKIQVLFLILLVCLVFGYCLVAANHSYSAKYNIPVPQYILGRYLMQFSPVMMVVCVWVLDFVALNFSHLFFRRALLCSVLVVALLGLSWGVLFDDLIMDVFPWFSNHTANAVDVFNFDSVVVLVFLILSSLFAIVMLRFGLRDIRLLVAPLCLAFLMNFIISHNKIMENNDGIHASEIFKKISGYVPRKNINIVVEDSHVSLKNLLYGLKFFSTNTEIDVNFYQSLNELNLLKQDWAYLLTFSRFDASDGADYKLGNKDYSFFQIDRDDYKNLAPRILKLDPSSAVAGVAFNQQPSGSSALGLFVSSASSQTVLKFAEHELPLVRGIDGFASSEIPSQYLAKPGIYQLRLVDQFTGLESDSVEFRVTAS